MVLEFIYTFVFNWKPCKMFIGHSNACRYFAFT